MKKIAFVSAVMALFATSASADMFGRNTNVFSATAIYNHNLTTSANTFTPTVGVAQNFGGIKLYGNTSYEMVGSTWSGVNVGVSKDLNENVFVDGWVNWNSGTTTANVEFGISF